MYHNDEYSGELSYDGVNAQEMYDIGYNNDHRQRSRPHAIEYNDNTNMLYRDLFDLELLLIAGILACFIGLCCFLAGVVIGKMNEKKTKRNVSYPDSMHDNAKLIKNFNS